MAFRKPLLFCAYIQFCFTYKMVMLWHLLSFVGFQKQRAREEGRGHRKIKMFFYNENGRNEEKKMEEKRKEKNCFEIIQRPLTS